MQLTYNLAAGQAASEVCPGGNQSDTNDRDIARIFANDQMLQPMRSETMAEE